MRRETSPAAAAAARVWKQATPQGRRNKGQRERERGLRRGPHTVPGPGRARGAGDPSLLVLGSGVLPHLIFF